MPQPKTVLIIGAGASAPYGFPVGGKLKEEIIEKTEKERRISNPHIFDSFLKAGFSEDQVDALHTALHWAFPKKSIDAFLEERPDLRDIGAFAIANILMHCENSNKLAKTDNWYRHLWEIIDIANMKVPTHIVGIITFNYERSLDFFLHKTLTEVYHPSKHEFLLAKLAQLPILHVHGDFGSHRDVPYTHAPEAQNVLKASHRIALVHDDLASKEVFVFARELLKQAERGIFLGFGYNDRNLERLGIGSSEMNHVDFFGTTWGMSKEEIAGLTFMHEKAFAGPACDCKTYLTQHLKNQFPEHYR